MGAGIIAGISNLTPPKVVTVETVIEVEKIVEVRVEVPVVVSTGEWGCTAFAIQAPGPYEGQVTVGDVNICGYDLEVSNTRGPSTRTEDLRRERLRQEAK